MKLLIFIFLIISCEESLPKINKSGFVNIKIYKEDNFLIENYIFVDSISLLQCNDIHLLKDFLITCSQDNENPLKIFDLKNKKNVFSGGLIGKGPDEQLIYQNISGSEDSTSFWISDIALISMNKYSIENLIKKKLNKPDKQIYFKLKNNEMPYNTIFCENEFLAPDLNGFGRIIKYNINGDFLNFFGNIPASSNKEFNNYKQAYAFQGVVASKSFNDGHEIIIKCNNFSSLIEVYNELGNEKFTIISPLDFISPYETFNDGIIFIEKSLRYASMDADISNKFIYIAYSGLYASDNNFSSNHNQIYVYDFNGNPINKINFNEGFTRFEVSDDDSTIYALSPKNGIMIFKII